MEDRHEQASARDYHPTGFIGTPVSATAAAIFSPAFIENPYPTYRHHLDGPAVQLLDANRGYWGVFRHAHCVTLFRDPRLSSVRPATAIVNVPESQMPEFEDLITHMRRWLLLRDPPSHTTLRRALNKGFTPAVIGALRPRVEAIVAQLLDRMEERGTADIVRDLAYPLPVRAISDLLGIPASEHERCVELTNTISVWFASIVRSPETARPAQEALLELVEIFKHVIADGGRDRGGLLGLLIDLTVGEAGLAQEELHAQCAMLLFGGHETTRHWIGNSVHTLMHNSGALDAIRVSPELIRAAMEEVLRYESPVQMFGRSVTADIELDGVRIPKGNTLLFVIAAAHRDADQFPDPDRFDIHRSHNRHFAFGGDAHVCLGSTLARLEGNIALRELTRRFPRLQPDGPGGEWSSLIGFRGLRQLRVRLG
jgi:cytochrome P450